MSEGNGNGSFWTGLLIGAVAGAIATILYAPNSGEETRSVLKEKKENILGKANFSVDDARKQAESVAEGARERCKTIASAALNYAEEIKRRGQVILEEQINNTRKACEETAPENEEILMSKDEASAPEREEAAMPKAEAEAPEEGTENPVSSAE